MILVLGLWLFLQFGEPLCGAPDFWKSVKDVKDSRQVLHMGPHRPEMMCRRNRVRPPIVFRCVQALLL